MPSADYNTETWKFGKWVVEGCVDNGQAPDLPEGVDINAPYYKTAFTVLNAAGGPRRNTAELQFHWMNSMAAFETQNVVPQDFLRFNTLVLHLMGKDSDVCRTGLQFFRAVIDRRAKVFSSKETRTSFVQSFFNRVVVTYLVRAVSIHEYDHPYVQLQNDTLHLHRQFRSSSVQSQLKQGVLNKKRFKADMRFVNTTLKQLGTSKPKSLPAAEPRRRAWYKIWQAAEPKQQQKQQQQQQQQATNPTRGRDRVKQGQVQRKPATATTTTAQAASKKAAPEPTPRQVEERRIEKLSSAPPLTSSKTAEEEEAERLEQLLFDDVNMLTLSDSL